MRKPMLPYRNKKQRRAGVGFNLAGMPGRFNSEVEWSAGEVGPIVRSGNECKVNPSRYS
jgi:hypothetical protein